MTPIVLPTICALDCPDACSLHITVEGDRVTHLTGDPSHPVTQGFACVKMARYPQRQEQDDRLLLPQRRVGKKGEGRFETISWETALDEIAERTNSIVKQHGPQSILPYCYGGTMGVIEGSSPFAFFRASFKKGARCELLRSTLMPQSTMYLEWIRSSGSVPILFGP